LQDRQIGGLFALENSARVDAGLPIRIEQARPAKIAFFLLELHPKMPDMGLSRREAADLAAYIATLK
jgi:hypothetical protein